MCAFFEGSRYVKRMGRPAFDAALAKQIALCQEQSRKTYGYRKVQIWLERQGIYPIPKPSYVPCKNMTCCLNFADAANIILWGINCTDTPIY